MHLVWEELQGSRINLRGRSFDVVIRKVEKRKNLSGLSVLRNGTEWLEWRNVRHWLQ